MNIPIPASTPQSVKEDKPQQPKRSRRYRDFCLSRETRIARLPPDKQDLYYRLLAHSKTAYLYG